MQTKDEEGLDLDRVDVRPKSQEGVAMVLLDPAGKATKVSLIIRGTDCQAYKDMLKAQLRRQVDRMPRKSTEEEKNAEFYELHATLIAGWTGLRIKGQPHEYSPENAARLLEAYDWVFEQVRRFADNRANFLPGPSSS
jgi:hypothetical protein